MNEGTERTSPLRRASAFFVPYALALAALSPFCFARLAPSMDVPAHLALTAVAQSLAAGDPVISGQFEWGVFVAPNTLFYLLALALGTFLPLTKAGVAIVFAALVLAVVGYTELAVVFGRSRYVAVALVPVAAQWTLIEGLVDYTLGLGLMGLALSRGVRFVDTGARSEGVAAFFLSALVFVAHIQATLTYVAVSVFVFLVALRRPLGPSFRAQVPRLATLIAAPVVLTVVWRLASRAALDRATAGGSTVGNSGENRYLELLFKGPLTLDDSRQGHIVLALFFALAAGRFLHARAQTDGRPPSEKGVARSDATLFGLMAGSLLVIALAPVDFGHYFHIGVRAIPLVWWVGVILAMPREAPQGGRLVRAARYVLLIGAAGVACALWVSSIELWNGFTRGFVQTLARAPQGSRLIMVRADGARDGFASNLAAHLHQYHLVLNRGMSTFTFGYYPGRIVHEIDGNVLPQSVHTSELEAYLEYGCYEYVLSSEPLERAGFRRVAQNGVYTLYHVPTVCPRVVAFRGGGTDDGAVAAEPCPQGRPLRGLAVETRSSPFTLVDVRPLCGDGDARPVEDAREDEEQETAETALRCSAEESLVGVGGSYGRDLSRLEIGCARGAHVRRIGVGTSSERDDTFFSTCPAGTIGGYVRKRIEQSLERVEVGCVAR